MVSVQHKDLNARGLISAVLLRLGFVSEQQNQTPNTAFILILFITINALKSASDRTSGTDLLWFCKQNKSIVQPESIIQQFTISFTIYFLPFLYIYDLEKKKKLIQTRYVDNWIRLIMVNWSNLVEMLTLLWNTEAFNTQTLAEL